MTKQEILISKASEIQGVLDKWVRESGYFSAGETVKLSFQLVGVSGAIIACDNASKEKNVRKETNYYRYLGGALTNRQWSALLGNQLSCNTKIFLQFLQLIGNVPTLLRIGQQKFSQDQINRELRALNLKFVLVKVDYDLEYHCRVVQLQRVVPKKLVMKWWTKGKNRNRIKK